MASLETAVKRWFPTIDPVTGRHVLPTRSLKKVPRPQDDESTLPSLPPKLETDKLYRKTLAADCSDMRGVNKVVRRPRRGGKPLNQAYLPGFVIKEDGVERLIPAGPDEAAHFMKSQHGGKMKDLHQPILPRSAASGTHQGSHNLIPGA